MQNFPTLKTALPFLQLQPLNKKHIPFIVELLSNKEIQQSLFRVPTKISSEKQAKSLERMYDDDQPKEITYILTIKKLFSEKFIGYVKVKLIDWDVMSCYLSVALLPDKEYRGKGLAKATYDSFFDYLFSLGFMKIYGRTYETNIPTIKLNAATGFRFIGRQSDFILYPDGTSLDALFFEKLNPILGSSYKKAYSNSLDTLENILVPIKDAREAGTISETLLNSTIEAVSALDSNKLPIPLQSFKTEILESLRNEKGGTLVQTTKANTSESTLIKLRKLRQTNAKEVGFTVLDRPVTREQADTEKALLTQLTNITDTDTNIDAALWCGAYTKENWEYLRFLFMGRDKKVSAMDAIIAINTTEIMSIDSK